MGVLTLFKNMNNSFKISLLLSSKVWRYARWPLAAILLLFIGLIIYRVPAVMEQRRTDEQIVKIRATKLTLDDVMGVNLPPSPDPALVDATVAGIDANQNGIRDDVELAIFEAYPDSAKTRAALLQYALVRQMELTQELVNSGTVTTVAEQDARANDCLGNLVVFFLVPSPTDSVPSGVVAERIEKIDTLKEFINSEQFNTPTREKAQKDFYRGNLRSYGTPTDEPVCDIDPSSLPD